MLDASVNGLQKGLIIELDVEGGRFRTRPSELRDIGIDVGDLPVDGQGLVALDDVPGLHYEYLRETQAIDLRVDDARLVPEFLGPSAQASPPAQGGYGLVVNYAFHAQAQSTADTSKFGHLTASNLYAQSSVFNPPGTLQDAPVAPFDLGQSDSNHFTHALGVLTDMRFFTPGGTLYNSGFLTSSDGAITSRHAWTRMDTAWVASDPAVPRTLLVGDFISTATLVGGRAMRLGGIQLRSNFDLRPDLVTFPIPALGGSAVVPSAVDLYINGIRQFSGQASGGPFVFGAPPAITGAGSATIVVQDPLGRQVTTTVPLYVDAQMLRAGLTDYALEAGWFRNGYGIASSDYASKPALNAVLRHGMNDALTLDGHLQAASGLVSGAFGASTRLDDHGILSAWLGASGGQTSGQTGALRYRYISPRVSFSALDVRSSPGYRDLGNVNGVPFPRREEQVALGVPLGSRQSITVSWNDLDAAHLGHSSIGAIAYNANIGSRTSFFVQAYEDFVRQDARGVYLGLVVNLDNEVSLYTNATKLRQEALVSVGAAHAVHYDTGGFGWNVEADSDVAGGDYRHALASVGYLGRYGQVQLGLEQFRGASMQTLDAAGALVLMDGTVHAARVVDDAFAMVSTDGVGGIPVIRENRLFGVTDSGGHLVIPDLRSFQDNRLEIDTIELPADVRIDVDHLSVVPRNGAGVLAHFPVSRYKGASLLLVDEQGRPLPVGSRATLADGASALVGYDGLVFFDTLGRLNHLTVDLDDRRCIVEVPYDPAAAMTTLGPFVCAPGRKAP